MEVKIDATDRRIIAMLQKDGKMTIKDMAEQLARLCLLLCLDWAANTPASDDPSQLSR